MQRRRHPTFDRAAAIPRSAQSLAEGLPGESKPTITLKMICNEVVVTVRDPEVIRVMLEAERNRRDEQEAEAAE